MDYKNEEEREAGNKKIAEMLKKDLAKGSKTIQSVTLYCFTCLHCKSMKKTVEFDPNREEDKFRLVCECGGDFGRLDDFSADELLVNGVQNNGIDSYKWDYVGGSFYVIKKRI